jgi:hypothetical protein
MKIEDFISFDKMITPTIIKIIYLILAGLSILGGLFYIFKGISSEWGGGAMVIGGLFTLILGPLWARITCEIMIVLFKIHTRLTSIDETLKNKN